MAIRLPDPEDCRTCHCKGRVIDSRRRRGYRRRRHECPACGHRWSTYQTRLNPRRVSCVRVAKAATALSR